MVVRGSAAINGW